MISKRSPIGAMATVAVLALASVTCAAQPGVRAGNGHGTALSAHARYAESARPQPMQSIQPVQPMQTPGHGATTEGATLPDAQREPSGSPARFHPHRLGPTDAPVPCRSARVGWWQECRLA
jgi:hypothetical protein